MKPIDTFTQAYLEAALWSSVDGNGEPMDNDHTIDDVAPETLAAMVAQCADFQESFGEYIADDLVRAGHDFWLTRNRHGAGFWDGDWDTPYVGDSAKPYATVGDFLTDMAHAYGSYDLYVGDDGLIYGQ